MFSKTKLHCGKLFKNFNEGKKRLIKRCVKNKYYPTFLNAIETRQYDLPLDNSEDSRFLILLIALMSFLAVLALSGTIALNSMTNKWSI